MEKKDLTQTRQYYGFLSLLLVLFALIPNAINAQGSLPIRLAGGFLDIDGSTTTQPVVLTGSTTDAEFVPLTIKGGSEDKPVEVTLQDVTLTVKQDDYWGDDKRFAGIVIDENSYVKLTIDGENYVRGGRNCAGIYVSNTATLVIDAANADAKLTCIGGCKDGSSSHGGGAGIGANVDCQYGNIIINGGIIYAEGCKGGAGIGGSWGGRDETPGKITINGGNVTAKGSTGLSGYFCTDGIGSIRTPATVEINGGFINASVKEGSTVVSTTKTVYKSYSNLTPGQEVDVYCWDNVNSVKTKVSEDGTLSFLAANDVNVFGDKKLIQTGVSDAGHASITPGGIYAVGDKVTLTVSVNDQQYVMTGWEDDKSNSNLTREITVGDEDATYKANIAYLYGDVPACVNNEYQIYNVNQLKWFRDLVNGALTDGTGRKKDANAKLMADIDLQYEAWTPIGKYDPWYNGDIVYAGTFDGNNHTISNLKVEKVYCSGFFGRVDGHVKNLGIINADLKCSERSIGVIAGMIFHADIKNCYAVGDLKLNASVNCKAVAGITNYGEFSSIQNSYTSYSKVFDETNTNHAGTENCQADIASNAHLTGELAYLLNSHKQDDEAGWGQAIGTDTHPVTLTADNVVYKHGTAAEASTISLGTGSEDRITTLCYPAYVVLPNKVKAFTISSLEETDPFSFARMDELKSDIIAANSPVVLVNTGGEAATLNLPAVSGYYSNNETASDIISQSGNLLKGAYSQMSLDNNMYSWDRSAFVKNHGTSTLSAYKCYFESESRKYAYNIATNEPVGEIEYAVLSEEDNTCYVSCLFYAGIGTKDYTVSIPATVQINGKEYEVAQLGSCDDDSDNKSFGNMNCDRNIKFYVNLPKTLKTVSKLVLSNMAYNAAFGCSVCFKFTTEEPPVFKVNSTDPRYYGAELIVPYAAEELYKAAWGDEYVNITSNKTELDIANGYIWVSGNEYTQGANNGTINETLVIKGTSTENSILVDLVGTEDEPLRIAINGLSIDLSNQKDIVAPAIILSSSNVSLIVQGTNTLKKSPLAKGSIELEDGASLAINKLSTGTLDVSDGIDGDNVEVAAKVYDGLESFAYQNIKAGSTLGTNQLAFGLYAIPGVENFVAGGKCEKFVLSDAVNFYSPEAFTADAVKYKRTFEDNEFNSLYLPFSAKVDDFPNCEFYVINMFHQNDTDNDGVLDNITLEVDKVPAGSTLLPNHPYLFKYTGDNLGTEEVFNLSNIEVSATKTPSFECSSMSYKYEFVGNYQHKASADYADYYVIGVDNTTGKTALVHPTTDLPAMRWAMKMTARESQFGSASLPLPAKMFIHINGEDNTTGISNVATEDSGCEYYGLDGVRKDKMAKGINIVKMKNGRVVKMVRR